MVALLPEAIQINDIAEVLSQVSQPATCYSMAQHAVLVSRLVEPRFALHGLLHSAARAYLSEQANDGKLPIWKNLEERIWLVIEQRFGLFDELTFPEAQDSCADVERCSRVILHGQAGEVWRADRARQEFLARFDYLWLARPLHVQEKHS